MTANAKIAELLRQQAEISLKLADEYEALGREAPKEDDADWVKIREFCETYDVSDSTLRRYIQQGMPHRLLGPKTIRINVSGALAWMHARGIEVRRRRAA